MGACALKIVKYGLKQMGYSKNLTRVLTKITDQEFLDLMKDMEFRKKQINKGISLRDVRLDFIHQIYIQSMGEFQFTGGTPITPSYAVNDADMQKMVEHTNNRVCSMLFGKKWRKDKQQRQTERGQRQSRRSRPNGMPMSCPCESGHEGCWSRGGCLYGWMDG